MGLLRTILALSVVFAHAGPLWHFTIVGGDVAVQCFYIISGFFIALILNEKYVQAGDWYVFYTNRFLRIYGLYWPFLLLATAVAGADFVIGHRGTFVIWHDSVSRLRLQDIVFLVTTNIILLGQDWTLFLRLGDSGLEWTRNFQSSSPPVFWFMVVSPAWSLGLELLFYLLAPFVVRRSIRVAVAIAMVSGVARVVGYVLGFREDPWSYRFFPFELSMFMGGVLAYHIYTRVKSHDLGKAARSLAYGPIVAVVLFPLYDNHHWVFFTPAKIALYGYLVLGLGWLYEVTRDIRWDRFVGQLSYPIYLSHIIFTDLVSAPAVLRAWPALRTFIVTVASVAVSVVVVTYLDAPLDRFRQRRVRAAQSARSS